ncbi:MAG: SDR family oxidoreductase [Desulfobacterales bacterium]|nr:SDR family oxidoreductase [Desulfobacterales bacterium]
MKTDVFQNDALIGKSILVTGGGSGLGKEIGKALCRKGAVLHICGRRAAVLDAAAAEMNAEGLRVHTHICDIRDADQVESMMETIWAVGPLTGVVNNAAANFIAQSKDLSPRGYRAVTSTVMDGSFFITLAAGKRWIAQGIRGSVVSNLVTWVWTGSPYALPSAMSKSALHAMTMSLAVEWGKYGIRLNATAPGPFPTDSAWERLNPNDETRSSVTSSDQVPMGRFGRMEELQNLVVFLLSDACEYLTGQTIAIDGGQHLAGPGTFADLGRLTDEQWTAARDTLRKTVEKEKAQRSV